jgi:hypothetical protein
LKRKEVNLARQILRLAGDGSQLQITDARTDRDVKLMSEDHSREGDALLLTTRRLGEQVGVPREEETERARPIEQRWVIQLSGIVLLGRQNVRASQPKTLRDR